MQNTNMEKIFTSIYESCSWGSNGHNKYHGSSGDGSSLEYNVDYINFIKDFIIVNNIKSVSDAGCGDWRVGSQLFYNMDIKYDGYDVYSDLINFLKTEYNKPNFDFHHLDVFNQRDLIKSSDLLIVKDVMQHWNDSEVKEFVNWFIKNNNFKYVLIINCTAGRDGMSQEGSTGGWRGLSSEHPIFKEKGFYPVFRYHTKEIMLYKSFKEPYKEIYKLVNNFRVDKKFWDFDNLTGEQHVNVRSKAAPYIKLGIYIAKKLGLNTYVEIGSSRYPVNQNCIDYFNLDPNPVVSPPCCSDGHSTFFWTKYGFEVYTVDIDENCKTSLSQCYSNIGEEMPKNLNIHIPYDGIDFLKSFEKKIDILFLDGWDKGTPFYAEKHLEAFIAAKNKLSEVHLVIIDDTDFITNDGGKDKLLTPYLIEIGYIPLVNGRQTIFINTLDIEFLNTDFVFEKNEVEDFEEINLENLEISEKPKVILSLSTLPSRLIESRENWGVKPVIERLTTLSYDNYEIHFNIPYVNFKTGEEYVIPNWLYELEKTTKKLKIYRCDDYGAITKIVPTLKRIVDPNQIIIILDDDINYMDKFIEYHLFKREKYKNTALGFAGIGAYNGECHLCTTLKKDTKVKILEGYKTVSVERGFFTDDFFTDFVGKSWSDDIVISAHLAKNKIDRVVMNYMNDRKFNPVVESFPIINAVPNEASGCYLYRSQGIDDNNSYFYNLGYFN